MNEITELTIFLSSPNDYLEEERTKFKDLISEIEHSSPIECKIKAIKWESDVARSSVSTFQENINILMQQSDLVIFMFCNRLGINTYKEYKLSTKLGKQTFITQKEYQLNLSNIEDIDELKTHLDNYVKLRRFLKSIEGERLIVKFGNYDQFKYEVMREINHIIRQKEKDRISKKAENFMRMRNNGEAQIDMAAMLENIQQGVCLIQEQLQNRES